MSKKNETIQRPIPLKPGESASVVSPIYPSVVYASETPDMLDDQYEGRIQGYTYAREGHPNATALAKQIDLLEQADGGIITGSGMAAITAAIMGSLSSGDHIVGGDQLYGRSLRLMKSDLPRFGIEVSLSDMTNIAKVRDAIKPNTKLILIELVSNPTLRVADIVGIVTLCQEKDIKLLVDNTFTTPKAFKPMSAGADIVVNSVTKLLAGHSDITLGYVVAKDETINRSIYDFAVTTGLTPSPYECWLAERGLMTFPLRFESSQATATILAQYLSMNKNVDRVLYPTLPDHPDAALVKNSLGLNGCNLVSFELKNKTREAANRFVKQLEGIAFAPTLGDVGTTLSHPASSSHRGLSENDRLALGITEGFFRVSVGLEDPDTLKEKFEMALKSIT
ncbi:MAG: trans-sulfuration enzyme family protein [Paracoccaceae bacterium]|uniref:trans-sulfuration enzyme family protein n=1 Tax=Candidatus Salinivivens marinus TaxID=3381703 RepID=UPI000BE0DD3F|nr:MAG: cystathionine gamma-synthase [Rhodobacteraceae bacterium MED-G08]|tara:strand:- start:2878 stop:4059 length:1182 start_codon:yes stop_codon:yes gene_type:complete